MITKYLRRQVKALTPRTRGVFLLLTHAAAWPGGAQAQFKADRIDIEYSTLKITATELETGLAEIERAGMISIDDGTITIQPRLLKSIQRVDENDPEQAGRDGGILRDYCYGEIPEMRRPRSQIWCEEIDGESITFQFTRFGVTSWQLAATSSTFPRPVILKVSPYDDPYEGDGLLEIVALMSSQVRFKVRAKLKRAKR